MMLPPDPEYVFNGQMDAVMCLSCKLSEKVEQVYAGTQSGKVHVWSLKTMREIGNFQSGDDSCLSINIPEDDYNTLITQNKSGLISFWNEENNQWNLSQVLNTDFFGFCKAILFQGLLYTAVKDGNCQIISVKSKSTLKTVKLSSGNNQGDLMAIKVFYYLNQPYILAAFEGHKLILWSIENFEKMSDLTVAECPMAVDFDVKTCRGICGNPTNQIQIFTLSKSLEMTITKTISLVNDGVASLQIRPDSKLVAVGCWDGKIRLYSWKTLTLLAALDTHTSTVQDVLFMKNSQKKYLLLAGSKDSKMSLWDIYN